MGKQDQIDRLGERVGELEITVNGDDLAALAAYRESEAGK